MNPMKEEYLEIEEIEYGTPTYKHILFEPSPIGVQQVQGQKDQSRLTIDIDVHDDDLLKKLLNKFQMSFIYPFLKGNITYIYMYIIHFFLFKIFQLNILLHFHLQFK